MYPVPHTDDAATRANRAHAADRKRPRPHGHDPDTDGGSHDGGDPLENTPDDKRRKVDADARESTADAPATGVTDDPLSQASSDDSLAREAAALALAARVAHKRDIAAALGELDHVDVKARAALARWIAWARPTSKTFVNIASLPPSPGHNSKESEGLVLTREFEPCDGARLREAVGPHAASALHAVVARVTVGTSTSPASCVVRLSRIDPDQRGQPHPYTRQQIDALHRRMLAEIDELERKSRADSNFDGPWTARLHAWQPFVNATASLPDMPGLYERVRAWVDTSPYCDDLVTTAVRALDAVCAEPDSKARRDNPYHLYAALQCMLHGHMARSGVRLLRKVFADDVDMFGKFLHAHALYARGLPERLGSRYHGLCLEVTLVDLAVRRHMDLTRLEREDVYSAVLDYYRDPEAFARECPPPSSPA
jgi:hypothetical protein